MLARSGVRLRSGNTVTFPIRDTRGRLAAGRSLQIDNDAAWAGEWRMFWLWREMGRNSSVSEPFAWQLRECGRKGRPRSHSQIRWSKSCAFSWERDVPGIVFLQRERLSFRGSGRV